MKILKVGSIFVQNSAISNKSLKLYTHTHSFCGADFMAD